VTAVFTSVRNRATIVAALRARDVAEALVPNRQPHVEVPGVPEKLLRLADTVRLPRPELVEAIPLHADVTCVVDRWLLWLLEEELREYKTSAPVAALYRQRISSDEPTREEWAAAANAAIAAARAAAANAAIAAARAAAAAANAAIAAARAAAAASRRSPAAYEAVCERMRTALLRIVQSLHHPVKANV
jgi:hypothetical protein